MAVVRAERKLSVDSRAGSRVEAEWNRFERSRKNEVAIGLGQQGLRSGCVGSLHHLSTFTREN